MSGLQIFAQVEYCSVTVSAMQDPYVTLCLQSDSGQKGKVEKTSYKNDAGGNAAFNETLNLVYSPKLDTLHFELFDWNQVTAHELLASQNVSLRTLFASHNAFSLPVESEPLPTFTAPAIAPS